MGGLEGWHPDPFGIHEERLFKDGAPTPLVKDKGVGSYHEPTPDRTAVSNTTSADAPPPAWYDNPLSEGLRYWDGTAWTQHFARPASAVPSRHRLRTAGESTDFIAHNGIGWILVTT